MRLGLLLVPPLFVGACFSDPPSVEPSTNTGSSTAGSTGRDESTSAGSTTDGSSSSGTTDPNGDSSSGASTGFFTTGPDETGVFPPEFISLFELTCTIDAVWSSGKGPIPCANGSPPPKGPYVDAHETFPLPGGAAPRVVEVRPPDAPGAPIDGVYAVDTSGFDDPVLRFGMGCVPDADCRIDFAITPFDGPEQLGGLGGQLDGNVKPDVYEVPLPASAELTLSFNANIVSSVEPSDRALWIDPRIEELVP